MSEPRLFISDELHAKALARMKEIYGISGERVLQQTLWMAFDSAVATPAVKARMPNLPDIPGMEDMKERIRLQREERTKQFAEIHRLGIMRIIDPQHEFGDELAGKLADEVIACSLKAA